METARGAGVLCTLGATLTALVSFSTAYSQPLDTVSLALLDRYGAVVPTIERLVSNSISAPSTRHFPGGILSAEISKTNSTLAGINTGDTLGINTGDVTGINTGDVLGINTGDVTGINTGDVLGINTGDVTGINTGDVLGINTGDVTGINTGDVLGINTGDVTGINTGDVLGINTGDVTGINTGDVLGINTGDVTGINTGDVTGINTGDVTGINTGDVTGINTGDVVSVGAIVSVDSEFGSPGLALVLSGPVESIDLVNGVFTSMGQTVVASTTMLRGLSEGDYVSVNGSVMGAGWLYADGVSVSEEMYVPGASPVVVTGIMSSLDEDLGSVTVGGLTVDYTPAMGNGILPRGNLFVFSGIQPVQEGVLLSTEVLAAE